MLDDPQARCRPGAADRSCRRPSAGRARSARQSPGFQACPARTGRAPGDQHRRTRHRSARPAADRPCSCRRRCCLSVREEKPPQRVLLYTYTRPMHLKPTADNTIVLKSPREIAIMREAGKIVAATIRSIEEHAAPGVTTRDLDQVAASMFKAAGAESTALGYFGYPGHICVSVNDEVVHGIPGPRKLKRGDLVKVDVAARYRGYVADSTHCFAVGGLATRTPRA